MPTRAFSTLIPSIAAYAPGCPAPTIIQYVRNAAIEACERTLYWRFRSNPTPLTPLQSTYNYVDFFPTIPALATTLDASNTNSQGDLADSDFSYVWDTAGSFGVSYGTEPRDSGKYYFEIENIVESGPVPTVPPITTLAPGNTHPTVTLSNGNLTAQGTLNLYLNYGGITNTYHNSGKRYFEFTQDVYNSTNRIAIGLVTGVTQVAEPLYTYLGLAPGAIGLTLNESNVGAGLISGGSFVGHIMSPFTSNGDVVGVAIDFDAGKLWFSKNGVWAFSGNPSTGSSPTLTFTPNTTYYAAFALADDVSEITANFGATSFAYTIPSGFSGWATGASVPPVTLGYYYHNTNGLLSNGNLTYTWNLVGSFGCAYGTLPRSTGKYYFEVINTQPGGYGGAIYDNWSFNGGISTDRAVGSDIAIGTTATAWGFLNSNSSGLSTDTTLRNNNTPIDLIGTPQIPINGYLGVAVDFDAGKIWFNANGTWVLSGNPAAGTNPAYTFTPNITAYPGVGQGSRSPFGASTINFGATTFVGTKPAGFLAWNATSATPIYPNIGFSGGVSTAVRDTSNGYIPGADAESWGFSNQNNSGLTTDSSIRHNGVVNYIDMVGIDQIPQGGYLGVAVDFDAGKMWFNANGSWPFNGDPSTNTLPTYTFTPNTPLYPAIGQGGTAPYGKSTANFGASPWANQLPTGYEPWNGFPIIGLDAEVHAVFDATLVNGPTLEPLTLDTALERFPKWDATDQASQPQAFCQFNHLQYVVLPKPEAGSTYQITMTLALKPTRTAVGMDEDVFNELEDLIVHGTLQRLLMLPNQNWTDYEMAKYHKRQYLAKLTERRARANLGNMRGPMFVKIPPFT